MPVTINGTSGLVTATTFSGSSLTGIDTGKILQVKQTTKTDVFSGSGTTFADITGLTVDITPSSSSNKILVSTSINIGSADNGYLPIRLLRNSTALNLGTTATGNQTATTFMGAVPYNSSGEYKLHTLHYQYLDDAQNTNVHTYKLQISNHVGSNQYYYLNRPHDNANTSYIARGGSTIIAMEVAA